MLLSTLIIIALGITISFLIYYLLNGITPMPTSRGVRESLLKVLPSEVSGAICELGAGWGTLAMPLARKYPQNQVVAYENFPIPGFVCWLRGTLMQNLSVRLKNFYKEPLRDSALVVCYLYPGAMVRLSEKLKKELRPGAWILSHTFALPDWEPCEIYEVADLYKTKIYLYRTT